MRFLLFCFLSILPVSVCSMDFPFDYGSKEEINSSLFPEALALGSRDPLLSNFGLEENCFGDECGGVGGCSSSFSTIPQEYSFLSTIFTQGLDQTSVDGHLISVTSFQDLSREERRNLSALLANKKISASVKFSNSKKYPNLSQLFGDRERDGGFSKLVEAMRILGGVCQMEVLKSRIKNTQNLYNFVSASLEEEYSKTRSLNAFNRENIEKYISNYCTKKGIEIGTIVYPPGLLENIKVNLKGCCSLPKSRFKKKSNEEEGGGQPLTKKEKKLESINVSDLSDLFTRSFTTATLRFCSFGKYPNLSLLFQDKEKDGGYADLVKVIRIISGIRQTLAPLDKIISKKLSVKAFDFVLEELEKEYPEKKRECLKRDNIERLIITYYRKLDCDVSLSDNSYPENFLRCINANLPGYGTLRDLKKSSIL